MKFLKFLLLIFRIIITIIILLIVSIILMQKVFDNKISVGGYRIFTIISESMVPEYEVFDVIVSKDIEPNTLKIDDDIVYLGEVDDFKDKIITHRIINIDKENQKITTKGIANVTEDPEISYDRVYGKVAFKSKLLSLISKLVNNPHGFYFIIIVPAALLLVSEFIEFRKNREEKD